MNSVDMTNNLIFRAKNLHEFTVTTEVPTEFKLNGLIPFDMQIKNGILTTKIWAVEFDEAAKKLDDFLGTCK